MIREFKLVIIEACKVKQVNKSRNLQDLDPLNEEGNSNRMMRPVYENFQLRIVTQLHS